MFIHFKFNLEFHVQSSFVHLNLLELHTPVNNTHSDYLTRECEKGSLSYLAVLDTNSTFSAIVVLSLLVLEMIEAVASVDSSF